MKSVVVCLLCVIFAAILAVPCVAQLPKMDAVEAEVKPAVEQAIYDSWFLKTMVVRADNDACRIRMIFVRYNYAAKKMSPDPNDEMTVEVDNAYREASKYTSWQQLFAAIVPAATKVARQHELLNRIAEVDRAIDSAGEGEDTSALTTQKAVLEESLAAVLESMGPVAAVPE